MCHVASDYMLGLYLFTALRATTLEPVQVYDIMKLNHSSVIARLNWIS